MATSFRASKVAWFIWCVVLFIKTVHAQIPVQAFGNFSVTIPAADVQDKFDRANGRPVGLNSFGFLVNPFMKKSSAPIYLGLETNWFVLGKQEHAPVGDLDETETRSRFNGINGVMRFEPPRFTGKIRPFVDVIAGAGLYTITTRDDYPVLYYVIDFFVSDDANNDGYEDENIAKYYDASFQQGLAVGIRSVGTKGSLPMGWNLRLIWMRGQDVDICRASEAIVNSSSDIQYPSSRLRSGYVALQLGISLSSKP